MTASAWRRCVANIARTVGATLERTNGGHWRLVHPRGWFVITAATPSDWRSEKNLWRDIRLAQARPPRHSTA